MIKRGVMLVLYRCMNVSKDIRLTEVSSEGNHGEHLQKEQRALTDLSVFEADRVLAALCFRRYISQPSQCDLYRSVVWPSLSVRGAQCSLCFLFQ